MVTLHIEHTITDLATWTMAFGAFAETRRQAGVRSERVRRPADDPNHVVVDLEFDTIEQAAAFLHFLRTQVWVSPDSSPALAGTPEATLLEPGMINQFLDAPSG